MNVALMPDNRTAARGRSGGPVERPRLRMLLSSAGRRVGLLRAFRSSAGALGVDLEMFACDLQPEWSPACLEADYAFAVPSVTSDDYIDALLTLCERNEIGLLVPTIDTELLTLSLARDRFAAIDTTVSVSGAGLVEMARDKLITARFLADAGIASPRTASVEAFLADGGSEGWSWPLLAKPRHGSASRGIHTVADRGAVEALVGAEPYVVQDMLEGREFTVNCYFDENSRLQSVVPHERLKVRAGEVEKGVTLKAPALEALGEALGRALENPFGALCFQAIVDRDGTASVFEINARFGGGYPLAHHAGATFTRWLIEQRLDLPRTAGNDWRADVVMLRYDDAVFF